MERLTQQHLKTLLKFVRGFYACHNRDAFVSYLLYGISTFIPTELAAFAEIDVQQGRIVTVRAEPSSATFPECRQILERYLPQHPHFVYYQQTGDANAMKLSDFLSRRQFHALKLYSELYAPMRVEYEMSVALSGSPPFVIAVALHRNRRDFSERDRLLLNLFRPHMVQAYVNVEAISAMRQEVGLLGQAIEARGYGVVLLTKDGHVQLVTDQARQWLVKYFGHPSRQADRLPEVIRPWITHQELSLEAPDKASLPRESFVAQREAARLEVRHLCEADRCILLMEERLVDIRSASSEPSGLTRREAEVLLWVAQGKTNAEIGTILSMSRRTVQKHLERIYRKLGVETRIAAARRIPSGEM